MNSDLQLVRKLLLYFDEKPGPEHVEAMEIAQYDKPFIKYHSFLLYDAGYLRCEPVQAQVIVSSMSSIWPNMEWA